MGKIALNTALTAMSGRVDAWVYRNTGDGFVVAKRPTLTAPPTQGQMAHREVFRAAAAYAKGTLVDPIMGPRYAAEAKRIGQRPFALAVADYFKHPAVLSIVTDAYHGAVGDPLDIRAIDDFEVVGVTVAILDAANVVLEQGPAVFVDNLWRYPATTAIPVGTAVTIKATATDRPKNEGTLSVQLVVA